MKSTIAHLLLAASLVGCGGHEEESARTFDFSAMEHFWTIQAALASDRDPTDAQWSALFETAGFRALTESEFSQDFFRDQFDLAFRPSRSDELEAALQGRTAGFLRHYITVAQERPALEQHAENLRSSSALNELLERASAFLPPDAVVGVPDVAFVIFANDGRAYDPIVIDLQASRTWDFESFLAHEFHHWYRDRVLVLATEAVDEADQDLIWTLNQIHAEGMADLIDKRSWAKEGSEPPPGLAGYAAQYLENLTATPALLATLDSLLSLYATADPDRGRIGAEIRGLVPQSGHPTGFYMASAIVDLAGLEALTGDLGNPFAFFKTFNAASIETGSDQGVFSPGTLELFEELERRYATR